MAEKRWLILMAFGVALAAAVLIGHQRGVSRTVTLYFVPSVGGEPLILDEFRYPNPGGDGTFKVRDLQFFVSGVRLRGAQDGYVEGNSYHLVRFDDGPYSITLTDLPDIAYERVEFSIGVDSAANSSIVTVGDLDPNGRMAWNWESGYKFILFEGALSVGDRQMPLVYHIGFDENLRRFSFPIVADDDVRVELNVDLMRLFTGVSIVDMATMSNVKFDRTDAKVMADNYARLITLATPNDQVM